MENLLQSFLHIQALFILAGIVLVALTYNIETTIRGKLSEKGLRDDLIIRASYYSITSYILLLVLVLAIGVRMPWQALCVPVGLLVGVYAAAKKYLARCKQTLVSYRTADE